MTAPLTHWPYGLAKPVADDYGLSDAARVSRTALASGPVHQTAAPLAFKVRRFDCLVRDRNVPAFRDWVRRVGSRFFVLRDLDDGEERSVRIVGAVVPLNRQPDRLIADGMPAERYWRGTVEVEGIA